MQDLWADYAGEALATEEDGRGGGFRRRRLTDQAALMVLRAWLLRDYMVPYGASLSATRIFQRCYWLDGLGHPRAHLPGFVPIAPVLPNKRGRAKQSAPASPLPLALQLAGETAQQLAGLARPITLYGFALDEKRGRRVPLEHANGAQEPAASLTWPREGGMLAASWQELAPAVLASLEQSAAVFLLNPLKDGLFRYADLAPLYQRTAPTELFLWLSHKQMETRLLPMLRTPTGAAALTNLLRGDRWKALLPRAEGSEENTRLIPGLIELFAASMRPHFLSVQQLAFPVRSGPALVEAAPYSLLFATRRQDSLFSLNDAVCKRARVLVAESQQGILNEEWFSQQRAEQAAARLEDLTREALGMGQAQRVRRWPDLRLQLLLKHFGQHPLAEYDQVITGLLARGVVRCEWRKRTQEGERGPVPGPEDLLLWS